MAAGVCEPDKSQCARGRRRGDGPVSGRREAASSTLLAAACATSPAFQEIQQQRRVTPAWLHLRQLRADSSDDEEEDDEEDEGDYLLR